MSFNVSFDPPQKKLTPSQALFRCVAGYTCYDEELLMFVELMCYKAVMTSKQILEADRERALIILLRRFGLDHNPIEFLKSIAPRFSISPCRVRQIQCQALRECRSEYARLNRWSYNFHVISKMEHKIIESKWADESQ